jgi:ribonuclease HI
MDSDGRRSRDQPPGEAGIGIVLKRVNKNNKKEVPVESLGRAIGRKANDVAEYEALIEGLRLTLARGATHVRAYMDSEFVVEQVDSQTPPKEQDLVPLYGEALRLIGQFAPKTGFRLSWVPRARNREAD